ncbi:hypothetical protein KW842_01910 [Duganella sp. sic0402]|uniref:hypothetical protein n=1 Tax=Duganella sp. sic0402 TaxID=2854786 RepID=UPI001C46D778|nr:hypothetical protein [Duganella sp. sic0402]MBV7534512.1 hypothetical protein [Duganella sp. sic0402]
MDSRVGVRASSYDGFDIEVAASLRGALWYPDYQIKKGNEVISHWSTPETDGRQTHDAACDWGVALATEDIKIGLKQIFS